NLRRVGDLQRKLRSAGQRFLSRKGDLTGAGLDNGLSAGGCAGNGSGNDAGGGCSVAWGRYVGRCY
ncbi:MAG: hypothetical protein VX416_05355, partial [Pseudomonadota bacterium]|nr:hypothetical protein [Pseudomonadota bacterium]